MSERNNYSDPDDFDDQDERDTASASKNREDEDNVDPWASGSAFADEPVQIVEEVSDGNGADASNDEESQSDSANESVDDEKPKSKPNPAILAVAAALGLLVIGGVGWFGMQLLNGGDNALNIQPASVPMEATVPGGAPGVPGGVAVDVAGNNSASGAASVVVTDGATSVVVSSGNGVDIFGDKGGASAAAATADSPMGAPGISVGVPGASASVSPSMLGAEVQAQAQTQSQAQSQAQTPTSSASSPQPAVSAAVGQASSAAPSSVSATAQSGSNAWAAAQAGSDSGKSAVPRVGGANGSSQTGAAQSQKEVTVAQARPRSFKSAPKKEAPAANKEREEFLGDAQVRVVAIYPQSGKFAQAWLRDEVSGLVHIVRAGDPYKGSRVRTVQPEQMRVVLEDGRIFGAQDGVVVQSSTRRNRDQN